jgi:hypothetical protein
VSGTAPTGYQTFSARYVSTPTPDANIPFHHQPDHRQLADLLVYLHVRQHPARNTIIFSSNGDAAVTFPAGTSDVVTASSRHTGHPEANTFTANNTFPNTGLRILDTNASHALTITTNSNITADRTLTVTTGDASRTLDISASKRHRLVVSVLLLTTPTPAPRAARWA